MAATSTRSEATQFLVPSADSWQPIRARFDNLFEAGRAAVAAGNHRTEEPLRTGGRWGLSIVLRPDPHARAEFDTLTRELLDVAGEHHWPTGAAHSSHITVRGIQPYRERLTTTDPLVRRCRRTLYRATHDQKTPRFEFVGLAMTPSCVMACGYPADEQPTRLAAALRDELRGDAWLEEDQPRTIWHLSLLHYAGPIADPDRLVRWVNVRRDLQLGELRAQSAQLVTFEHAENGVSPRVLAEKEFAGDRES